MIIWTLLLAVDAFIRMGGWVLILCADMFLRAVPPYARRMQRGKYSKWVHRKFGPFGDLPVRVFLALAMVAGTIATDSFVFVDVFYAFLAITLAVDWITGSEDPPWRRWAKSGAEILKKLRIQPAPQPVLER